MNAKKVMILGLMIAVMTIVMVSMAVAPASAYTIRPAHDGVQLYMEDRWDAWCLATFPSYAADVVIDIAEMRGIDNQRTEGNIAGEIRAHALAYLAFGDSEPQNPMNIVLTEPDWWPYHLMD